MVPNEVLFQHVWVLLLLRAVTHFKELSLILNPKLVNVAVEYEAGGGHRAQTEYSSYGKSSVCTEDVSTDVIYIRKKLNG